MEAVKGRRSNKDALCTILARSEKFTLSEDEYLYVTAILGEDALARKARSIALKHP